MSLPSLWRTSNDPLAVGQAAASTAAMPAFTRRPDNHQEVHAIQLCHSLVRVPGKVHRRRNKCRMSPCPGAHKRRSPIDG